MVDPTHLAAWAVNSIHVRDIGIAIDRFIGELTRRGCTPATCATYFRSLVRFADSAPKDTAMVTVDHVRAYLDSFSHAKPATVAHQVSILTTFFAFLVDEGVLEQSPTVRVRRPRVPPAHEREVVSVSSADVQRMLQVCESWSERVCIALLAYTGCRRNAASRLRWRDVDVSRRVILFREKGRKVIEKPIADELALLLAEGIRVGALDPSPDEYVIPSREPNKLRSEERNPKVIYHIVKNVSARAGVDCHVHALRAAFAVRFLETNTGEVEALQQLMGHSRLETTATYLRRFDRQKAMERVRSLSWGDTPDQTRTGVTGVKGQRPRPLDDRGAGQMLPQLRDALGDAVAARRAPFPQQVPDCAKIDGHGVRLTGHGATIGFGPEPVFSEESDADPESTNVGEAGERDG